MKVAVIDYESGNLTSVCNALEFIHCEYTLTRDRKQLASATHLILPGVGSYKGTMEALAKFDLVSLLSDLVMDGGRYFLGICVGMQILSKKGDEFGETSGLGWIDGITNSLDVKPFGLSLPHVGWNEISGNLQNSKLLSGLKEDPVFYFVHSFSLRATEENSFTGYTHYGEQFVSMVEKDNIFGVQFHPEKSQQAGLQLLRTFTELK